MYICILYYVYLLIYYVYLLKYSHSDKTTENRININNRNFSITLYFVTNKQTYLTVGNGHHFSGEAWYMRSYKQTKLR